MKFLTPTPSTPKSLPWGMTQAMEWKSCLMFYITFICKKTHRIRFKIFEIDFVIEIKCYLTFWSLSRGGDPKNVPLTLPYIWVTHSPNLVKFRKIKFLTPQYPQVPPWGMIQATECKFRLICYISSICEKTHKAWFKIIEIDFVTKILWYFTCN